jgi:hypothetical protein
MDKTVYDKLRFMYDIPKLEGAGKNLILYSLQTVYDGN